MKYFLIAGLLVSLIGCSHYHKEGGRPVPAVSLGENSVSLFNPKTAKPLELEVCGRDKNNGECNIFNEEYRTTAVKTFSIIESEKKIGSVSCCVTFIHAGKHSQYCRNFTPLNTCPSGWWAN